MNDEGKPWLNWPTDDGRNEIERLHADDEPFGLVIREGVEEWQTVEMKNTKRKTADELAKQLEIWIKVEKSEGLRYFFIEYGDAQWGFHEELIENCWIGRYSGQNRVACPGHISFWV
jgi:uncharacterized protein (DUF2126 family)